MPDLLIDLDLYGEHRSPPEHTSLFTRPARRWIAAALIVVLLLAMGPTGGKPRAGVQHVADMAVPAVATMVALNGNLFILEPGALTLFDSRTARQRWRIQTDLDREYLQSDGDLVIVTGIPTAPELRQSPSRSMIIDVDTGQVVSRLTGNLEFVAGFIVFHEISFAGIEAPGTIAVYDPAGRPIWSISKAASLSSTVDPQHKALLTLDPTIGELVEYRLDSGEVLSRALFPELVGAGGIGTYEEEVYAFFPNGGNLIRGESGLFDIQEQMVDEKRVDCGTVWCAYSFGIRLIDKATGEVVHRGDDWRAAIHTDFGVLGIHAEPGGVSFFDPRSRRVQSMKGWSPVGATAENRIARWHGPLYLVANVSPRTFFAVLDGATIRIVGSVPHEHLPQCAATAYLVACRIDPRTVRAWHLE